MVSSAAAVSLASQLDSVDSAAAVEDDFARTRLIQAARSLVARIEKPWEGLFRIAWQEPCYSVALKVGVDLGLFQQLTDSAQGHSIAELAKSTSADSALLKRILRSMSAHGAIQQIKDDYYVPTPFSRALATKECGATMGFLVDLSGPALLKMPEFLKRTQYVNPTDVKNCPFQLAFNTKDSYFEWLHSHAAEAATFNTTMSGYNAQRVNWFDFYPVKENILIDSSPDVPLLVDVGGGYGHDISRFAQRFPEAAGRLVLQDLPMVVADAKADAGIQVSGHDFFTPQPVAGASAYYMHSVLHDWPDAEALRVLQRTREAMDPFKSRLLLNEMVITAHRPDPLAVSNDLTIMAFIAGKERDETAWRDLLGQAELEIVKIYDVPGVAESLIEVKVRPSAGE